MNIKYLLAVLAFFYFATHSISQHISSQSTNPISGDIYHLSGRLGVGTSSPTQKLHVQGDGILLKRSTGTSIHLRNDSQNSYINNMNDFVGNGSSGNQNLIFTAQNDYLFKTGNSGSSGIFRMILKNDGKVGIGTEAPDEALHVMGKIKVEREAPIIELFESDNAKSWFLLGDGKNFDIRNQTLSKTAFRITDDGNIGIGTSTPTAKLEVKGSGVAGTHTANFNNTQASSGVNYDDNRPVSIRRSASNNEALHIYTQDAATYFTYRNDEAQSKIHFRMINTDTESGGGANANDNYVMSIKGDKDGGAVSIGLAASPPGYKLSVDGKAIMEEVVVQLTGQWPDYVFSADYEINSLEEVKKHIAEKGHLPNIPSAEEVEESGVSLGEMNRLLLEKIEELTLYIIDQEERIKKLETRIK